MESVLALDDHGQARDVARLGNYARQALEIAAHQAHRLHAQEVAPEHFLSSLFLDETAAATRLVLFAFADPETLSFELLALSPGIMVIGSDRSLPFSVRGVRVLEAARSRAVKADTDSVTPADLLFSVFPELEEETRTLLGTIGLIEADLGDALPASLVREQDVPPIPAEGSLFARFRQDSRRALGSAARAARQWERAAISPAHVLLGALEADSELAAGLGVRPNRVRMVLGGRDLDTTPLEARRLPMDKELSAILSDLEDGANTASILGQILSQGSEEARLLLQRQRVTWELFERAQSSFEDPDSEN